jgi:hypothetical protein
MVTKYFLGENRSGVFAVYKANFEGNTITNEVQYRVPEGGAWKPTKEVSEWFWKGNDTVTPCNQQVAEEYLSAEAKAS